jgi:hypothetical protein
VPDLISYDEAVTWARTHQVGVPSGGSWRQKVDLRLSASSLPILAQLLGSTDMSLKITSSLALQYNGARIDSDATELSEPTFNRVTFPDGSELTVFLNLADFACPTNRWSGAGLTMSRKPPQNLIETTNCDVQVLVRHSLEDKIPLPTKFSFVGNGACDTNAAVFGCNTKRE